MGRPKGSKNKIQLDPIDRFWKKVDKSGDCWVWTGFVKPNNGYGVFWDKKHVLAHVFSYTLDGELEQGEEVMHICDNPPCVRRSHLKKGSHLENMRDSLLKGRNARGEKIKGILTKDLVLKIRKEYSTGTYSHRELAKIFNVGKSTIHTVVTKQTWSHV